MADVGSATSTMVTTTKETSTKETNYREIENYLISKQYPAYITGDRSKKVITLGEQPSVLLWWTEDYTSSTEK